MDDEDDTPSDEQEIVTPLDITALIGLPDRLQNNVVDLHKEKTKQFQDKKHLVRNAQHSPHSPNSSVIYDEDGGLSVEQHEEPQRVLRVINPDLSSVDSINSNTSFTSTRHFMNASKTMDEITSVSSGVSVNQHSSGKISLGAHPPTNAERDYARSLTKLYGDPGDKSTDPLDHSVPYHEIPVASHRDTNEYNLDTGFATRFKFWFKKGVRKISGKKDKSAKTRSAAHSNEEITSGNGNETIKNAANAEDAEPSGDKVYGGNGKGKNKATTDAEEAGPSGDYRHGNFNSGPLNFRMTARGRFEYY